MRFSGNVEVGGSHMGRMGNVTPSTVFSLERNEMLVLEKLAKSQTGVAEQQPPASTETDT